MSVHHTLLTAVKHQSELNNQYKIEINETNELISRFNAMYMKHKLRNYFRYTNSEHSHLSFIF